MLTKVAVNKKEIDKLVRVKKYKEAVEQVWHVRDIIELIAKKRVDALIEEKVITESERNAFFKMIVHSINKKLLEDEEYVLMDEEYIERLKENFIKLRLVKKVHLKNR